MQFQLASVVCRRALGTRLANTRGYPGLEQHQRIAEVVERALKLQTEISERFPSGAQSCVAYGCFCTLA